MFGVLPIDKPAGFTSRDVVNRVQRLVRPYKLGHTGTLDPMATGVLLLAVGRAVRLVEYSHAQSKSYQAEFLLGQTSDTLDSQGQVEKLDLSYQPTLAEITAEAAKWVGTVQQVPPKFSAVHVQGKRAHDLARQGKDFSLQPRTVVIHRLDIVEYAYPRLKLLVECGTGTYIRSLGSDLARGLGSDAIMCQLVRTRIGPFELSDCVSLDALQASDDVGRQLAAPQLLVSHLPQVALSAEQARAIRNGIPVELPNQQQPQLVAIDEHERLTAILQPTGRGLYRSLRVFQAENEVSQPKSSSTPHRPES